MAIEEIVEWEPILVAATLMEIAESELKEWLVVIVNQHFPL
ncbi:hypothetical protein [Psychrobacillus sp. L3]